MQREIWTPQRELAPESYKVPTWLYLFKEPIPDRRPTSWAAFFKGTLLAFVLVAFLASVKDEERPGRYAFSRTFLVFFTSIGTAASFLGALAWRRPFFTDDDLLNSWLKDKARADSYSRKWTDAELWEIKKITEWNQNFAEHTADERWKARCNSFRWRCICRLFLDSDSQKLRPDPKGDPRNRYLCLLAAQIQARIGEQAKPRTQAPTESAA